jgi:hypothetical protein
VSGNDVPVIVDQDRIAKAKPLETIRDLANLLSRMRTRIPRSGTQSVGRNVFDLHRGHRRLASAKTIARKLLRPFPPCEW